MTAPQAPPAGTPRPADPADAALFDAVANEHAVIYGYGLVSPHTDANDLVSAALTDHRDLREQGIARLRARRIDPPLPAAGYGPPFAVTDPASAARLAVRMEEDDAVAWRAVLEQASAADDRSLAVDALTRAALNAARWRARAGIVPVTVAFPGG